MHFVLCYIHFVSYLQVRNKPGKVVLNLKGEGYAVRETVQLEEGEQIHVLNSGQLSRVDFGTVQLNERAVKRVALINSGKFSFDFHWTVPKSKVLEITPELGTVKTWRGFVVVLCFIHFVLCYIRFVLCYIHFVSYLQVR